MRKLALLLLPLLVLLGACPSSPPRPPEEADGGAGGEGGGTGGDGNHVCPPLDGFAVPSCGPMGCWEHPLPGPLDVELGAVDAAGGIWIAGAGTAPLRFDGSAWTVHAEGLPDPDPRVRALHAGPGGVWVVQGESIFRLEGDRWTELEREPFPFVPNAIWHTGTTLWVAGAQIRRHVDGVWEGVSVVGFGPFHALWGSGEEVWAVGAGGAVFAWRNGAWIPMPTGTELSLRSIWGSATDAIWIGAEAGRVLRYDGLGYASFDLGTGATILSIAGSGPDDVLALGYDAQAQENVLFHWNGRYWLRLPSPPGLTPLTLWPSSEGVWVGGKGAGLALWDGNCLRVQPGQQETIEDLWGGTWAVGRNGLVLHRTDAGWQRIDVGVQTHLRAVWSWAGEIWIAGDDGLLLRGGAEGFRPVLGADGRNLLALHGTTGGPLWIGSHDGQFYRMDGVTLRRISSPSVFPIRTIASFGEEAWAGSNEGEIVRWRGMGWEVERLANGRPLLFGTAADDVWLAGFEGGAAMIEHWSGAGWKVVSAGGPTTVYDLAGDDEVLYVAHAPRILHVWNGATWEAHVLPVRPIALSLDEDALWILGERHLVRWREGRVETIVTSPHVLTALHVGGGRVWVGTVDGRVGTLVEGALFFDDPVAEQPIRSIHGEGDEIWAVGDRGTLLRHAGSWQLEPIGTEVDFREVFVHDGRVWIASAGGLLRKQEGEPWTWHSGSPPNVTAVFADDEAVFVSSDEGGVYALDRQGGHLYFVDGALSARAIVRARGALYYGGPPMENGAHFFRFDGQRKRIDLGVTLPATAVAAFDRGRAIVAQGRDLLLLDAGGARTPLGAVPGGIRAFSRQAGPLVPFALGERGGILGLRLQLPEAGP